MSSDEEDNGSDDERRAVYIPMTSITPMCSTGKFYAWRMILMASDMTKGATL